MSEMLSHLSDGEFRIMNAIWLSEVELTQAMVMKTVNNTLDKKIKRINLCNLSAPYHQQRISRKDLPWA